MLRRVNRLVVLASPLDQRNCRGGERDRAAQFPVHRVDCRFVSMGKLVVIYFACKLNYRLKQ